MTHCTIGCSWEIKIAVPAIIGPQTNHSEGIGSAMFCFEGESKRASSVGLLTKQLTFLFDERNNSKKGT